MANIFAIASGNWSSGTTWDTNSPPTSADTVFTNGYVVTIDTDVDVNQLRNGSNYGQLVNMCIPVMTSNTSPEGVASAALNNSLAYLAFDGNDSTYYDAGANSPFTLTYKFSTPKIIKRFRIVSSYNNTPNAFTVQASDDPTFTTFATIASGNMPNGNPYNIYISAVLTNSTAYTYYRLNVTSNILNSSTPRVNAFDLTESLSVITNGSGGVYNTLVSTGGYYLVSSLPATPSTRTITVRNTLTGLLCQSVQLMIYITTTTGILNINHATLGNLIGGSDAGWQNSLPLISTATSFIGTLNINGNIIGQTSFWQVRDCAGVLLNGSCTLNVVGNLTAGGGIETGCNPISLASTASLAVVNVTGNLWGQQINLNTPGSCAIYSASAGASTINITGNITGGVFPAIFCKSTSNTSINVLSGVITATNGSVAINNAGTGSINILSNSIISASTSYPAIISSSSGLVTAGLTPIINRNTVPAILAQKFRFYSGVTAQWIVQDTTNSNITLSSISSSGITIGLPLSGDVRYLTTYGQNNEYVGSLRVPTIDNVRKGVQTDFTVGTADLTANDIFNAISGSTNSVAVRLRNVSTVQSAGDQIAGLS
jgi:hypothetical protein